MVNNEFIDSARKLMQASDSFYPRLQKKLTLQDGYGSSVTGGGGGGEVGILSGITHLKINTARPIKFDYNFVGHVHLKGSVHLIN